MDKDTTDRVLHSCLFTWRHRGVKLGAKENRGAHYCDFLKEVDSRLNDGIDSLMHGCIVSLVTT